MYAFCEGALDICTKCVNSVYFSFILIILLILYKKLFYFKPKSIKNINKTIVNVLRMLKLNYNINFIFNTCLKLQSIIELDFICSII